MQMKYQFHTDGTIPQEPDFIWVFGSNLGGRHGAGAAKVAADQFAARYGAGMGRTGHAYAIPTKDRLLNVLSLDTIELHVHEFLCYAHDHPELKFWVTRVGCGLSGYSDCQIAVMFQGAPLNCDFPDSWRLYL